VECYSNYIANKQTPTTEEERINRRMKGCQSAKKKFSCKVSVFDNTESHNVNNNNLNINEDIHYLNEKKSQFTNMNDLLRKEAFENKNDNNFLVVILSIIIIILIISVLHLYFKKK
jgi:hypothetical protein